MVAGWLAAGALAFGIHEYVIRRGSTGRAWTTARLLALALILAATAITGPRVLGHLNGVFKTSSASPATAFLPSGDATRTQALSNQRPRSPFPSGQPAEAIETWRRSTLAALRDRFGLESSASEAVPFQQLGVERAGELTRTLIAFESWDGASIPAYVHEPTSGDVKGAVLVLPGHGEGIRATAGVVDDYQHAAARELARHGYVTLTPELRGFGLLGVGGSSNHRAVAAAAIEAGTSYKAVVVKDMSRALTVLARWPQARGKGLAVAGTSLGGELAVLLGAIDARIRVVLSHSYGGLVGPAEVEDGAVDDAIQTPHGCHTIPGVNLVVLQEDWVRLLAPRPVLVVRGRRNTPVEAAAFQSAVGEAYSAFDAAERFSFSVEDGAHEFYLEPSLRFLARWL